MTWEHPKNVEPFRWKIHPLFASTQATQIRNSTNDQRLKHYATSRKITGSITDEVSEFFNWPNPSSRTMVLGSTQPLTEMSTRIHPGGKGQPARKADDLTAICELIVYKMWEPRRLTTWWASTTCYSDSFFFCTFHSSFGIATGYGLDDQGGGSSSPGRVKNFHVSITSRPALGSTQPPIKWVPEALSRG
jgi:hypothetical protein